MADCEGRKRAKLSWEVFCACVDFICPKFNVTNLRENQRLALYHFICGEEVFVNLPTGSGKSIIFQMAPLIHAYLHGSPAADSSPSKWKKDPILIVITPLIALMQDQVKKLTSMGLKAAYIGGEEDASVLRGIEDGKFTFVFLSPEATLNSERWRNLISSDVYQQNLVGIAVDEVHCVTEWGISSNNENKSAFRRWYSRLNELKSLVNVPFIALTATASKNTREKIFELLEFKFPKVVMENPNKQNIRYTVQELDKTQPLVENFRCIIEELQAKGHKAKRTIIYCQTVKQCAILFRNFEVELGSSLFYEQVCDPRRRFVEMMHSGSPTSVKAHVLEQFSDSTTYLRVLIATIAYGMGVNCKGVTRVIHFGPSKSIEAYMQESGRCGRDNEQSDALLLYNGINLRTADTDMKGYVKSVECRRKTLLNHFDGFQETTISVGHMCCDICAEACTCKNGTCDMELHLTVGSLSCESDEKIREVTDEQKLELKRELIKLQKKRMEEVRNTVIVSCPTILLEFGSEEIMQVVDNAELIFTCDDVLKHVDIWRKRHAQAILSILRKIFNDIEEEVMDETENDCFQEQEDEWGEILDDDSFLELMNQSEWALESTITDDNELDAANDSAYPEFLDDVIDNVDI